jgi:hypothetical protein
LFWRCDGRRDMDSIVVTEYCFGEREREGASDCMRQPDMERNMQGECASCPACANPALGRHHETSLLPTTVPVSCIFHFTSMYSPALSPNECRARILLSKGTTVSPSVMGPRESRRFEASLWTLFTFSKPLCFVMASLSCYEGKGEQY